MQYNRLNNPNALIDLIKALDKRVTGVETRGTGPIGFVGADGVELHIGVQPDGQAAIVPFVGDVTPPPVATSPDASAGPGFITVTWDGLFVNGETMPLDFEHLNVVGNRIVNGVSNLTVEVGIIRNPMDSCLVGTEVAAVGETWEFVFVSEDYNGNLSTISAKSNQVTQKSFAADVLIDEALGGLQQDFIDAQSAAASAQKAADDAQDAADEAALILTKKGTVYTQSVRPEADPNGLWIDTGNKNLPRYYVGKGRALFVNYASGASVGSRLTALGWNVTTVTSTPTLENALTYDLVAFDAGFASLSPTVQTLAKNIFNGGVSVFTSGNDTTAMAPLFLGSANRGATSARNPIRPSGTAPGTGWANYNEPDNALYLTGVDPSAIITGVTLVGAVDQPVLVAMEHATNFARWTHVHTYATPAAVLDAHLNWISDNWVAVQDQAVVASIAAAQLKADQAFNNAATAAETAGLAQETADSKNRNWYQDDQPAGTGHKVGDNWFDTNDGYKLRTWNGSIWQTTQDSALAQQIAESKGRTYTQDFAPPVEARNDKNLWIDTSAGAGLYVTKYWNGSIWTALTNKDAAAAQETADSKGETIYSTSEPAVDKRLPQNTWVDTSGGLNIQKRWDGFAWVVAVDSRIPSTAAAVTAVDTRVTGVSSAASTGLATVDSKVTSVSAAASGQINTVDSRVTGVSAAAGSAISTVDSRVTGVSSSTTTQVGAVNSKITSVSAAVTSVDSRVTGVSSAASAESTAKANAAEIKAIEAQAYSANASFEDWSSTYPAGFNNWSGLPTKETSILRTGTKSVRYNVPDATTQAGMSFQSILSHASNLEYFTVEVELYLVSGTLDGSGMILDWNGMSNNRAQIQFKDELPGAVTGKWYRVSKTLRRPTNATGTWTSMGGYLMGQWSGHGTGAAKNIIFDWFNVRPATTEEILAYNAPADATQKANTAQSNAITAAQQGTMLATAYSKNPSFDDWVSTLPDTYGTFGAITPTKDTTNKRVGVHGLKFTVPGTEDAGIQFASNLSHMPNLQYVTVEIEFMLLSGSLSGAGVLLDWIGLAAPNRAHVKLTDLVSSPSANKWYRVSAVVERKGGAGTWSQTTGWLMANWGELGSKTAKTIVYDWINIRPSTAEEILSYKAPTTQDITALDTRITGVSAAADAELTVIDTRVTGVSSAASTQITNVDTRVTGVSSAASQQIDNVDTRVTGVSAAADAELTVIDTRVTGVSSTASTQITNVDTRVSGVSAAANTQIGTVDTRVTSVSAGVTSVDSRVTGVSAAANTQIGTVDSRVTSVSAAASGQITSVDTRVTGVSAAASAEATAKANAAQAAAILAASTGANYPNQWLYSFVDGFVAGEAPKPEDFTGPGVTRSYINDGASLVANVSETYRGSLRTMIRVDTAKTLSFTALHDDAGSIYLDGVKVYGNNVYTAAANISFAVSAGWHMLELTWAENSGGDGWYNINPVIGTLVNELVAPSLAHSAQWDAAQSVKTSAAAVSTVDARVTSVSAAASGQISTVDSRVTGVSAAAGSAISTVDTRVTGVSSAANSQIGTVDSRVTSVSAAASGQINTVDSRVTGVSAAAGTAIGTVDARVTGVSSTANSQIGTVDSRVTSVSAAASGQINTVDSRVTGVSAAAGSAIGTVDARVTSVSSTANSQIGSVDSRVTSVSAGVTSVDSRVTGVSAAANSQIGTVDSRVTSVSAAASGQIGTVDSRVTSVSAAANSQISQSKTDAIAAAALLDTKVNSSRTYINRGLSTNGITNISGPAPVVVDSATAMGGKALQKTGTGNGWWADTNGKQAFDPSALYRMQVRIRVTTAPTTGGGTFYMGVQGYLADGTTLCNAVGSPSTSSQHYLKVVPLPAVGQWVDHVAYFKGNSAANASGSGTVTDPSKLHSNVRHFEPLVIMDYSNGNGVVELSQISVEVVDTQAALDLAAIDTNAKLLTKTRTYFQPAKPTGGTYLQGDVWIDSDDGNKIYAFDTTANDFKVAQDAAIDKALYSTFPTDIDVAATNKWLFTKYNKTTSAGHIPQYSDIVGYAGTSQLINDGTNPWINNGDQYIGQLRTIVHVAAAKSLVFSASHDDGARIYVDGASVYSASSNLNNVSFNIPLTAGWHVLDFFWAEQAGGDGFFNFSPTISSQVTSMFAPASLSAVSSTANSAVTAANGKNKVIYSTNDASGTTGYIAGDTWFKRDATTGVVSDQWEFVTTPSAAWAKRTLSESVIGNLSAGKIVADWLEAGQIKANSITADKLVLGTSTNLFDDGPFTSKDLTDWETSNQGILATPVFTEDTLSFKRGGDPASGVVRLYGKTWKAVTAGEKLHTDVNVITNPTAGQFMLYMYLLADNGAITNTAVKSLAVGANPQEWTVPAGTVGVKPYIFVGADVPAADTIKIGRPQVLRKVTGNLIVDGAIKAGSAIIEDAAISSAKIISLNADKINATWLEAGNIKAGAISASALSVTMGGNNLVYNSSFEVDSDNNGLADGWNTWARGAGDAGRVFTNTRVAGLFPGSTYAQRVTSTTVTNTEQSSIQGTQLFAINGGDVATLSLYGRASVAGTFSISMRCEDNVGGYKGDANFNAAFTTTTKRFAGIVVIPAGTTKAKVTITTPNSLENGHWFEVDGIKAELGDVPSAWSPATAELLPGTINATMIHADALHGKTITGPTIQTESTASRGIKLTTTEFAGYDTTGVKNFSLTSAGSLTLKGALTTGSTITGSTVTGSTIQTEATTDRGIKLTTTELSGFDTNGVKNFSLTSAGALSLKGAITSGSTITGATITGGLLQTESTVARGIKMDTTELAGYDASGVKKFSLTSGGSLSLVGAINTGSTITGSTVTGSTIQTEVTVSRGIKLTTTELAGYDVTGVKNFSLTSTGALTLKGDITSGSTITGATVTGSTVQTESTASRGIKLTSTELAGFDGTGQKNLSLTSTGALYLRGEIKSGSTIEGAKITGTQGIETSTVANTGVKINNAGIKAYDAGNNLTFSVDAATGLVKAPGLEANSIKGTMIEAGAVTTDKLKVGDFSNWVVDPYMTGTGSLNGATYFLASGTSVASGAPFERVAKLSARDSIESPAQFRPVVPGDTFYAEVWVRSEAAANKNILLGLWSQSDDGTNHWNTTSTLTPSTDSWSTPAAALSGWILLKGTFVVPATVATGKPTTKARAWIQINGTTGTETAGWWATGWKMYRQSDATTIENGAIKTQHMTAGTIDGGVITAGSLTSTQIKAKSILADDLVISSTDNLVVEADFGNNGTSWDLTPAYKFIMADRGRGGLPALRIVGTTTEVKARNLANKFTVDPANRYRASISVRSTEALAAGKVKMYLRCYTTAIVFTDVEVLTNASALVADTWTNVSGILPELPAGTLAVEVIVAAQNGADTTWTEIDYVSMTRAMDATLVVDGSITAAKVDAEAIQAHHLSANSVTASALDVEELWADESWLGVAGASSLKLVSSSAPVTALDPDGNVVKNQTYSEVNSQGLKVYNLNTVTNAVSGDNIDLQNIIKLGTFDEDFFSINKAGVPQIAMNAEGEVTAQKISVGTSAGTGQLLVNGVDLAEDLFKRPKGMLAWGQVPVNANMSVNGGEIGLFEIAFDGGNIPARMAEFSVNPFLIESGGAGTVGLRLRYTTDGGAPNLSSPIIGFNYNHVGIAGLTSTGDFTRIIGSNNGEYIRVLLTLYSTGTWAKVYSGVGQTHLYSRVLDLGETIDGTAIATTAGGTPYTGTAYVPPAAPKVTKTTEWGFTAVRSYTGSGAHYNYNTSKAYQGLSPAGMGNLRSLYLFPDTITSTITGSTINGIWLYAYFEHWYNGSGGTARFRLHSHKPPAGLPSTYSGTNNGMNSANWPRAAGRWVAVPSSLWDGFKAGTWKGFGFDGDGTYGTYGIANNARIKITYTK